MERPIAVAIPCYNEQPTIGKVIDDFRAALPQARIVVFDNLSTDASAAIAATHGAEVVAVNIQGKGYVVARMLEVLRDCIIIMVDGDDTYPAADAPRLLEPLAQGKADMVVGTRLQQYDQQAFRPLHVLGNRLVRGLINGIFSCHLTDIMSGYRAFTPELAANVPLTSVGFEVETELTLQTLYSNYVIAEVTVPYGSRPEGSVSKLRTFRDGFRVLWTIFNIARSVKPLTFFGSVALIFAVLGLLAGTPAVMQYLDHHRVESFPLLFVAVGLVLLAFMSLGMGVLLHTINVRLKEITSLLRRRR